MPGIGLYQEVKYESSQLEGLLEEGLSKVGVYLNKPDPIQIRECPHDDVTDYKKLLQHMDFWRQAEIGKSGKVKYLKTFQLNGDNAEIASAKLLDNKDDIHFDPSVFSDMLSTPDYLNTEVAFFEYQGKEIALYFFTGTDGRPPDFALNGDLGLLEALFDRFLEHPVGPLKYEVDDTVDIDHLRKILTREGKSSFNMTTAVNIIIDYVSSSAVYASSSTESCMQ